MEKKDDAVVVVREDGKEFLISRLMLAEHINRGFTVKDAVDHPSEEELSKAVGYRSPAARAAKGGDTAPEPATVPKEKPRRKPVAKKAARKKAVRR